MSSQERKTRFDSQFSRMNCQTRSTGFGWRARSDRLGFGVGLAMGPATVGRIGYENRFDYTAIGCVVNLAARLCAPAADQEILIEEKVADAVTGQRLLDPLGTKPIKGYEEEPPVYGISFDGRPSAD